MVQAKLTHPTGPGEKSQVISGIVGPMSENCPNAALEVGSRAVRGTCKEFGTLDLPAIAIQRSTFILATWRPQVKAVP